jgi:hypothetical protein
MRKLQPDKFSDFFRSDGFETHRYLNKNKIIILLAEKPGAAYEVP